MGKIKLSIRRMEEIVSSPLLEATVKKNLDNKAAYWAGRAIIEMTRLLEEHYKVFNKIKKDLIEELGEKDESGKPKVGEGGKIVWASDEAQEKATTKLNELRNEEEELSMNLIKLDWEKGDGSTVGDMMLLCSLLEPPKQDSGPAG